MSPERNATARRVPIRCPMANRTSESTWPGPVHLTGDGLSLDPIEYAACLSRLAAAGSLEADYDSLDGSVERLEIRMAELLGKERAVFFPTGTQANLAAISVLAPRGERVLASVHSHLFNDAGDGAQRLLGVPLVGLHSRSPGEATFSLESVEGEIERAASSRIEASVGAIAIESPVRRLWGQTFDFDEMQKISVFARERGIGLHLDGARVFLAEPYTGVSPRRYAELFDTVYISMWKYFNAPSGAILAGDARFLDGLFHTRRRLGGSLHESWPLAAVALEHIEGFSARFRTGIEAAEEVFRLLEGQEALRFEKTQQGTNVAGLYLRSRDPMVFRSRLARHGIHLGTPLAERNGFKIQVNETWSRLEPEQLAGFLLEAST